MQNINLEELTSRDVGRLIAEGWDTVIVPLGATEQHGPALPLCVDTLHGLHTALRAARRLGRTLVGPAVNLGDSHEHTSFPGTVSIDKETMSALLRDIALSHARTGFRYIYFWPGHGGSYPALRAMLDSLEGTDIGATVAGPAEMAAYIATTWERVPPEHGVPLTRSGSHAGEFETSMTLALAPELVWTDRAEAGNPAPLAEVEEQMMSEGIHTVAPNGVLGDQRGGEPARGEIYLDALAAYLSGEIRRLREEAAE